MRNENVGHGHVFPRPDGVRARCGGPGFCKECSRDKVRLDAINNECCDNPSQCWEECGDLGKSDEHAMAVEEIVAVRKSDLELIQHKITVLYDDPKSMTKELKSIIVRVLEEGVTPEIVAWFECVENGITGTTRAPIKRIEKQDDGAFLVIIDHWPKR